MTDEQLTMAELPDNDLLPALTSLLFTALEPVPLRHLGTTLGCDTARIRALLSKLEVQITPMGLGLTWFDQEQVQLTTAPRFGPILQRFHGLEKTTRLSQAALEVLAIIAYRQPATRADIEIARGVDSSGVMHNLLARELIMPVGRLPIPGQPIQYATTPEFLHHFGLSSLHELPDLPEEVTRQFDDRTMNKHDSSTEHSVAESTSADHEGSIISSENSNRLPM